MKLIFNDKNRYVLRFDPKEEVIAGLTDFCNVNGICSGYFSAIGACEEVDLAYYNLDKKKYEVSCIKNRMEIVSMTGNVAKLNDEILVHSHGVFSFPNMRTRGGHIKKIVVYATCEVFLTSFEGEIKRQKDDVTGLNLLF